MKKILLLTFILIVCSYNTDAQENPSEDYNKFSVEVNAGINRPDGYFSKGAFTSDNYTFANLNRIGHYDIGVRYMFNQKFGLKLDGAYDNIQPESGSISIPFETNAYRVGLQGVINFRNVLDFSSFSNRFGLLVHGGVHYSILSPQSRNSVNLSDGLKDDFGGYIIGFTPQFKITDRIAITADASFIKNTRQHTSWDGVSFTDLNEKTNLISSLFNFSLGATFYLGKHDTHADWADMSVENLYGDRVEELENKLAKIEEDMLDTDKDGVPDYLDREPNTTSGVAVNSKGEAVDLNDNGIPDELESSLNKMFVSKEYANNNSMSGIDDVKPDANDFLINVYFRFDSTQPEYYSLNAVDRIVRYMKKYPEEEAVLTGFTDQIGDKAYNDKLSEDRAKRVYDIVIASGIDASRLSYKGGGVDDSKDKDSGPARQLSRRVSFELK